jgi:ACS family hexuronate transporter-like MFS transporter
MTSPFSRFRAWNPRAWPGLAAGHRRWLIVGLLFLLSVVNYLDRQTLAVMSPLLRETLDFGPREYSYIATSFLVAYAIGYTFCARLISWLGVRRSIAWALAFWSVAAMMHATATGWVTLALCRFALGLGESFGSPGGIKAIAEWIPNRERATAMAIFSNGNILGMMLAPPLVAFIAAHAGWKEAFLITGGLGLVLLYVWRKHYHAPEQHPRLGKAEAEYILAHRQAPITAAQPVRLRSLLREPLFLAFFAARFLTDSTSYFFSFWLPDYFARNLGFSLTMIGLVGWIPYLAADLGYLGGGIASDALIRRGRTPARARLAVMSAAAALMPLALVAVRTSVPWLAVALIAVLLAAQSGWMVNQLSLISESVGPGAVAAVVSFSALGGSLGGILFTLFAGQMIAGYGYVPVFTVIGCLHLTSLALLVFGGRFWSRPAVTAEAQ